MVSDFIPRKSKKSKPRKSDLNSCVLFCLSKLRINIYQSFIQIEKWIGQKIQAQKLVVSWARMWFSRLKLKLIQNDFYGQYVHLWDHHWRKLWPSIWSCVTMWKSILHFSNVSTEIRMFTDHMFYMLNLHPLTSVFFQPLRSKRQWIWTIWEWICRLRLW